MQPVATETTAKSQSHVTLGGGGSSSDKERDENVKDFARGFYKSKAWQRVRDNTMKRDAWLCQDCLRRGVYTPAEEVHHIQELTAGNINDPEVSLNMANLVSLCRECHRQRHTGTVKRFTVDEFGGVSPRP